MVILLTIVHVIVCLFLVVVVLLQSGKAADLAGAFGGMGSQTVFGPRGSATILSKATTIAAALFMMTSLSLSIMATKGGGAAPSILDKAKKAPVQTKGAPAQAPGQPAQAPGQTGQPVPTATPITNGRPGQPMTIPVNPPAASTPAPAPAQK